MSATKYETLLADIGLRFSSSNDVPVTRASITSAEWEEIRALSADLADSNTHVDELLLENARLWAYDNDAATVSAPTLARCNAHIGDEKSPLERLRFFLSLALKRQDWIDVEPFLDALAALQSAGADGAS